ncbi:Cytochrome c-552 [Rubrivivax sp. A210]|nr:Cytochrome c-552 [Rubrivivax sp. A210]
MALLLLILTAAGPARANPELARERNCLNCHGLDRKIVGPAFKDVAARYAGKPGAEPLLAKKIIQGGGGGWGPVPMAANPRVSQDEARRLAAWVLTVK